MQGLVQNVRQASLMFVSGDIKLSFFDKDQYTKDKMFHIWFNTAFIENNYLCFEKSVVDKACKDKENKVFDPNFKLEIFLHKVSEGEVAAAGSQDSLRLTKAGGAGGRRGPRESAPRLGCRGGARPGYARTALWPYPPCRADCQRTRVTAQRVPRSSHCMQA